jgi:2-polyprenyl-6-methoxyphenol hydroxylase-like FAD-dependent oxidoreductase
MSHTTKTDVLICGAGAAGLTLAIELARRGVAFRLIEKMAVPFEGSRGKGIQPRTQEIFEDLGILDRAFSAGGLYPAQRVYRDDGTYLERDMGERAEPTPAEPYRLPLMVPQFITERIMRERLAELGHRVEFGHELRGFEQRGDDVIARVTGAAVEETLHARYLIGADGGRSFVRKTLGIGFAGKTLGVRALVADVELDGLSRDVWHQFNDRDMARMLAICPLAGTGLFQIQAPIAPDAQPDLSSEGLTRLIAERTGRTDIALRAVNWASDYQMNARLAARYREGRVFLVGDAAHVHPPTGGQGLNTSVQDAYNLGWKLAAALRGARPELLDSYETERRPVAEDVLGLSSLLLDAQKQGGMRRGREVQQLDIAYPDSPLQIQGCGYAGPLRAGSRAPDALIRGAAGQPSRLFELFRGSHWTLFAYETHGELSRRPGLHVHHVGSRGEFVDEWGHIRDAYGLTKGECVLVRPDGYIAAIYHTEQVTLVEDWLTSVGTRVLT